MSELNCSFEELKAKLNELKKQVGELSINYRFNEKLSLEQIERFEKKNKITLPQGYRNFLLEIGNGGYLLTSRILKLEEFSIGLEPFLENFLSYPFPFNDKWGENNNEKLPDKKYLSSSHVTGTIRIMDDGCGYYYFLVVNGNEYGNIWIDERVSDQGLLPLKDNKNGNFRIDFVNWINSLIE